MTRENEVSLLELRQMVQNRDGANGQWHPVHVTGHSRLFEPFYTTKPNGMGMGLTICRSIVEADGGRLWVSACQPRGALFQFAIPARPSWEVEHNLLKLDPITGNDRQAFRELA